MQKQMNLTLKTNVNLPVGCTRVNTKLLNPAIVKLLFKDIPATPIVHVDGDTLYARMNYEKVTNINAILCNSVNVQII